jgi:uncharacterized protein YfkK (UPF0435 family)/transglutaminase-like putative cysteine protease
MKLLKPDFSQLLLVAFLLLFNLSAFAQKEPLKIGKIEKQLVESNSYEKDLSANAVILSDYGHGYFDFDQEGSLQYFFKRQVRVKILNKNGLDWADWKILLYKSDRFEDDKITNVKGYTYNIVNGAVERTKFDGDIFETNFDKNRNIATITLPKVKEGSVIDFEYKIKSNFFNNINPWYFQYEIPVQRSEYYFENPEYLIYRKDISGYIQLSKGENYTKEKTVNFKHRIKYDKYNPYSSDNFERAAEQVKFFVGHYIADNVPAFEAEQPLSSEENYISKVEYELARFDQSIAAIYKYSTSWADVNKLLLKDEDFGLQLELHQKIYNELQPVSDKIKQEYENDTERMMAAYNFVNINMEWNHFNAIQVNSNLKKSFISKEGNAAEINLILVALLRKLEIEAYPLAGCTKKNGFLNEYQPKLSRLNYVVVLASINEKSYLMDATAEFIPCGMLPERVLNKRAWLVDKTKSGWIDLAPAKKYKTYEMINVQMDESGNLIGDLQGSYSGYAAVEMRREVDRLGSEEKFVKSIIDHYDGFSFESFEIENLTDIYKPVKSKIKVIVADQSMEAGNRIYFNPMMFDKVKENPYKLEERLYPVEYDYKEDVTYMLNLTLPEGFSVEEVPESVKVVLPDNGGAFTFQVKQMGGTLQVVSQLKINKLMYLPENYTFLKEFYNLIIEKHAEQIVLKKS